MLSVHLLQARLPVKIAQHSTWKYWTLFASTFFFFLLSTTARLCIFANLLVTMGKATSVSHSAANNSSALLFFSSRVFLHMLNSKMHYTVDYKEASILLP